MHFGARHMFVDDGRWLQPEPLLYMGVTNGDLANPLGYGPVYARGNSNMYGNERGEFAVAVPVDGPSPASQAPTPADAGEVEAGPADGAGASQGEAPPIHEGKQGKHIEATTTTSLGAASSP